MATDDSVIDLSRVDAFRVGPLVVEPPLCRVSTGETLEPRVMQVLVALARANGAVVSRDDLIRTCWNGRIVGDDSITRVIGRLRRLAEARGGGAFAIETLPKVGYRLIGDIQIVRAAPRIDSSAPDQGGAARRSRFPRVGVAIGAAVLAVALGGLMLWRGHTPSTRGELSTVQFAGFRPIGAGASSVLAASLDETTRSAFTEDTQLGIVSTGRPARRGYSLSGAVMGAPSGSRISARIDNASTGATLWARTFDVGAVGQGAGDAWVAAQISNTVRCGLSQAMDHGARLPDRVMSLLFAECDAEAEPGARIRALDLARQITRLQPNLASGWSSRAFVALWAAFRQPGPQAAAWKQEARRSAERALHLDATDSRALRVKADLLPPGDLLAIDRGLQAATRARVSFCGCAFEEYGEFLVGLGRATEARRMFERAHADAPLAPQPVFALARMDASEGRTGEAYALLDRLESLSPRPGAKAASVISSSPWTKDYGGALRELATAPPLRPEAMSAAIKAALDALATNNAAAKVRAAETLATTFKTCGCGESFEIRLLAALGDDRDALTMLSLFNETQPHQAASTIAWDPALAGTRRLPGFVGLADRAGLMKYWRASGHPPDFCKAADAPAVCKVIGRLGAS